MLSRIINEIRSCVSHDHYLAALSMALTIPDICGKAEYANDEELKNNTGKRYVQWYDEYIGQYQQEYTSSCDKDTVPPPYLSGELVYQLRNNVLHSGMAELGTKKDPEGKAHEVTKFRLFTQDKDNGYRVVSDSNTTFSMDGKIQSRVYSVSIHYLCEILCNSAEKYYNANKDKFSFFRYNIVSKPEGD